jgi:hypothetical protein
MRPVFFRETINLINSGTTLDEFKKEEKKIYMVTSGMMVLWLKQ